MGHQIGSDYLISLAKAAKELGIKLPDRELACAPILSAEGQRYLGAMACGINCALANRQIITHLTRDAFTSILADDVRLETLFDVSHNTCKRETHLVKGRKKKFIFIVKGQLGHLDLNIPLYQNAILRWGSQFVSGAVWEQVLTF